MANRLLVLLIGASSTMLVHAEAQFQDYNLHLRAIYYECVEPEQEPPCICGTEDKKPTSCPDCEVWAQRTLGNDWTVRLDSDKYSFAKDPFIPRANFLGKDIAKDLYKVDYPRTEYAYPITAGELFEDHEQLGWVALDQEKGSRVGALAVTRSWMGLVVSEDEKIEVVYPSSVRNGQLAVDDLNSVITGEEVQYLIPGDVLTRHARSGKVD